MRAKGKEELRSEAREMKLAPGVLNIIITQHAIIEMLVLLTAIFSYCFIYNGLQRHNRKLR